MMASVLPPYIQGHPSVLFLDVCKICKIVFYGIFDKTMHVRNIFNVSQKATAKNIEVY